MYVSEVMFNIALKQVCLSRRPATQAGLPVGWDPKLEFWSLVTSYEYATTCFEQFINIRPTPYLFLAHPSWRCTAPNVSHCYCLEFGTRANTSHHVWRKPKMGAWKITWCSTETSQNYCAGLWWAEHTQHFIIHLLAISDLFISLIDLDK